MNNVQGAKEYTVKPVLSKLFFRAFQAGGCLSLKKVVQKELSALLSCSNKLNICLVLNGCLIQV